MKKLRHKLANNKKKDTIKYCKVNVNSVRDSKNSKNQKKKSMDNFF